MKININLKNIIKYLILFVLSCIFIYYSNIINVKATSSTTSTILSDITFPLAIEIRDNISGFPSLNFSTNYGYDENYTSAWINKEIVTMNSAGVVVSIPEVLECGHSYVLYNYWAVNGAYMIDYSASSSRVLGVGLGLGNIPNLSITESINSGRFPSFEYVTTVATGTNQYADFTHVSMSYIKFTNNTCNGAQRNLYFSQMSNISATFQSNKLAYLGYRLIDTTTLSSSDHAQLDRIEESINNLTLAEVESKLNQIQQEQQNTSDAINDQIQQDKEQHEAEMEQDKQQHEEQMESQKVCFDNRQYNTTIGSLSGTDGQETVNDSRTRTEYIPVNPNKSYKITIINSNTNIFIFRYNSNKEFIDRIPSNWTNQPYTITTTNDTKYIRIITDTGIKRTILVEGNYCQNGNQALNDSLNNSDISGANQDANNFFNNFENNDFGLSDIITLPLTTIQSITSKSCTPLSLTLPFVNKTFQLPCMTTIYSKFEPFYSIYQTITFGVISYWVCVQIYAMVKGFKDPTSDEIEVMDL